MTATSPLTETSVRRLTTLAEFLEDFAGRTGPADTLEMGTWFQDPDRGCGTAACALGWATTIKALRDEGLVRDYLGLPAYGGFSQYQAAEEFFDITRKSARKLFGFAGYGVDGFGNYRDPAPAEVAARVRLLIAQGHLN